MHSEKSQRLDGNPTELYPAELYPAEPYDDDYWRRLAELLESALEQIPHYAAAADAVPPSPVPEQACVWAKALLARFPILSRRDIRASFPKKLIPRGFNLRQAMSAGSADAVEILAAPGMAADRLQVIQATGWRQRDARDAYRLNATLRPLAGVTHRRAVLTTPLVAEGVCHAQDAPMEKRVAGETLYLNRRSGPESWGSAELDAMAEEIERWQPQVLDADPAYLAPLARHLHDAGRSGHQPRAITLGYSTTSALHLAAIRTAFSGSVVRYLGAIETGVLFVECAEGRWHHNSRGSAVEFLEPLTPPEATAEAAPGWKLDRQGDLSRLVVTTLDTGPMPLIRFDTGKLVRLAERQTCHCGAGGWILEALCGSADETLFTTPAAGSRLVSADELDAAVSAIPGILSYQVVQNAASSYRLSAVASVPGLPCSDIEPRVRETLLQLFGADARVEIESAACLPADLAGRYRLARYDVTDTAAAAGSRPR